MHMYHLVMNDGEPVELPDHASKSISSSIVTSNKPPTFRIVDFCTAIYVYTIWVVCHSFKVALYNIIRPIPRTLDRWFTKFLQCGLLFLFRAFLALAFLFLAAQLISENNNQISVDTLYCQGSA